MTQFQVYLYIFLVTFVVWLALSLLMVANRVRHDSRFRLLQNVQADVIALTHPTHWTTDKLYSPPQALSFLSRRDAYRLVADTSQPGCLLDALSIYILYRWGLHQVLKEASGHYYHFNRWRRISALSLLAQINYPEIHELLRRAASDSDHDIVEVAENLLGNLGSYAAAETLVYILNKQKVCPARCASQLDKLEIRIPNLLCTLLENPDSRIRYWAVCLLGRYQEIVGLDARIGEYANDPDPSVRKAVAQTLGRIGGPLAAPIAITLLNDPIGFVRAHALRALGMMKNPEFTDLFISFLNDPDWWVSLSAKNALVALGPSVWPKLTAHANENDGAVREAASDVLLKLSAYQKGESIFAEMIATREKLLRVSLEGLSPVSQPTYPRTKRP